MPIYEYRCPSCGQTFELRRPMSSATDAAPCPACRADSRRIISRPARVARGGVEDDAGGDEPALGGMDDFGGGHGHSHGPMGLGH